jgi:hypothetical protein
MAPPQTERSRLDYQPSLRNFRPVLLTVGIVLALLAIIGLVLWFAGGNVRSSRAEVEYAIPDLPPGAVLLQRQERELAVYEWLDRDRKLARIPLQQAMRLLVEQGSKPFFKTDEPEGTADENE